MASFNWWDSEYQQRQDINSTRDKAISTENHIARLQKQVDGLVTMVMSLVEILAEDGKLDPELWKALVDQRLSPPPDPATGMPHYTCTKCKAEVDPANTTMTANGVVCDACAR